MRFGFLVFLVVMLSATGLRAEELNYFTHKKYFCLCSFKKECSFCESCTKDMYKVRIRNNTEKRIRAVYYRYYSPLNKRTITNEAVIQGDMIESLETANIYICVRNKENWAVSKIVYSDDSEVSFAVEGPLSDFVQEADECGCAVTAEDKHN